MEPTPDPTLDVRQVGRYELLRRIGQGGMAEVFLARRVGIEGFAHQCVVKTILPRFAADPDFVEMFFDEARITVELQHPNVVRVFDLDRDGELVYLAMEFVDGMDALSLMVACEEHGVTVPFGAALYIISDTLKGLHSAHSAVDSQGRSLGLVHRDVSPGNILLGLNGAVKLGDFGVARASISRRNEEPGLIVGKLRYFAPELLMGGEASIKSDIFAVGVVMFEMLAMEPLFPPAENAVQQQMYLRNWSPEKVLEKHLNFPEGVDEILLRALAVDPAKRYDSALEFGEDVIDLAHESGIRLGDQTMIQFIRALRQEAAQRAAEPDTSRFRDESRAALTSHHGMDDDVDSAPDSDGELTIVTSSADLPAVQPDAGPAPSASQFYGAASSGETPQATPPDAWDTEDEPQESFPPQEGAVWDTANQLEPLSGDARVHSALQPRPGDLPPGIAEPNTDPYQRSPRAPAGLGDTPTDRYPQPPPAARQPAAPTPPRATPPPPAPAAPPPTLGEVLAGTAKTTAKPGALPPVKLPIAAMIELFTAQGRHGPFPAALVEDTAMRSRLSGIELVSVDASGWEPLAVRATQGGADVGRREQAFGFLVLGHLLLSVARKAPSFEVMLWAGRNVSYLGVAARRVVASQLSSPRPDPGREAIAAAAQVLRWPGGRALPIRASWLRPDPSAPTLEEVLVAAMDIAHPPKLFRRIDTMRGPLHLRRLPRGSADGLTPREVQVYDQLGRGELPIHEIGQDDYLQAGLRLVARARVQIVRRT